MEKADLDKKKKSLIETKGWELKFELSLFWDEGRDVSDAGSLTKNQGRLVATQPL